MMYGYWLDGLGHNGASDAQQMENGLKTAGRGHTA